MRTVFWSQNPGTDSHDFMNFGSLIIGPFTVKLEYFFYSTYTDLDHSKAYFHILPVIFPRMYIFNISLVLNISLVPVTGLFTLANKCPKDTFREL